MLLIIENNVRKPNVGGRNVKQVDSSKVFRVPNQLVVEPGGKKLPFVLFFSTLDKSKVDNGAEIVITR